MAKVQEQRKGSWPLKLLLLLFGLLLALLASELLVRWLEAAPKLHRLNPGLQKSVYRFSDNPILGYVFKENYRDNEEPDLSTSYPYINKHGFRDRERVYDKEQGVKRIILLGDSVVAGSEYIKDLNDTISRKLEKVLEPEVEVLNISVNGYCTRAEVELLKNPGIKYAPDLVILVFVYNDYANINADLGRVDLQSPPIVEFLFVHSHLFRRLSIQFNAFNMKVRYGVNDYAGEWFGTKEFVDTINMETSDRADRQTFKDHVSSLGGSNVKEGLTLLRALANRHHFNVAIGIWPTFRDEGILDVEAAPKGDPYLAPEGSMLWIERFAEDHRFPVFRFSHYFTKHFAERNQKGNAPNSNPRMYYSEDTMHPNQIATTVAANAIKELLTENPSWLQRDE